MIKAYPWFPPNPETLPLILVHGSAGNHLHWPSALRRLPGTPVYALDLPGHGHAPGAGLDSIPAYADAVLNWAKTLGLERYVLAGHSMGGAIVLEAALRASEVVAGLILVGTGARLRVHADILNGVQTNFPVTAETLTDWAWAHAPQGETRARMVSELLRNDPALVLSDYEACNHWDRMADLPNIRCPALIVCGDQDKMTPPKYSAYLAAHLPHAELVILPDAGHMVALEHPQQVAGQIAQFMRQITNPKS